MGILMWDAPKKVRSSKEHAAMHPSDGGPPGTYVPNMSDEDMRRWKAKVTGQTRGVPQVEIRKDGGLVIVVCLKGGYTYKSYKPRDPNDRYPSGGATDRYHIHFATNGAVQMTFADWAELNQAVAEAKARLEDIEAGIA